MTSQEYPQDQMPVSELTVTARDTFTDALGFMDARSRAAAAAALRNTDGLSLADYYDEDDASFTPDEGDVPQ
jgi:hypothetical protein